MGGSSASEPGAGLKDRVRRLARKIAALPEGTMRRAVLAEELSRVDPEEATALLAFLRDRAPVPPHPEYAALEAFGGLLATPGVLPYSVAEALYAFARREGRDDLARFMLDSPAAERVAAPERAAPDARLADMPLGTRKQLARSTDRDKLDRLLYDPDPTVIRQLLQNPLLIERDVLRVVSRRPAIAEVLREVYRSDRWIRRYQIKRALCFNPFTPGEMAARLLPLMRRDDLRDIGADPTLHERVRADARELAERKRG